jgi:hypothetical protein
MRKILAFGIAIALAGCVTPPPDTNYRGWIERERNLVQAVPQTPACRSWVAESSGIRCVSTEPLPISLATRGP